jgi:hypothetical protein
MKLKEIVNAVIYDRRKSMAPIPRNRFWFFNEDQLNTYNKLIESGWKLYFIRRKPRFRKHTIAMIDGAGAHAGVIMRDGSFDTSLTTIRLRSTT